jgi:serine/threonine protein kinase
MFSRKLALTAARRKVFSSRVMAGAALSVALLAEYGRRVSGVEEEIVQDGDGEALNKVRFTSPSFWISPNLTSCDFMHRPRMSRLTRSRTIRRIQETSAKESVRSMYDVQWKNPLGEGGFGAVYLAKDRKTKELVAVKKISKKFTDDASFQKEMNAFLHIRQCGGHPNICGLRENFDEGDHYYLVLDLVSGGEMFDHLCSHGAYSEADAARLVREVGSALAFIHGIGCVHGDLKPENLMLSSENKSDAVIKVVDFGCAQIIDDQSPYFEKRTFIAASTPGYSPPEVIDKTKKLTSLNPSMDMFSLGVIIYIMLTGLHPFDLSGTATDEEMNELVLSRKGPPLRKSPITAHLSPSAIDLIETLIHSNPKKRQSAQQMLNHPWVRGETARTGKMADSDKRLSACRAYKSRLEAKVFASMVGFSDKTNGDEVTKRTSLIENSFHMMDPEHRGYITTKDLQKLDPHDKQDAGDDDEQLSLSGFSELLSENMKNRYFPAGHVVYREGEKGNNMYFINSGRVEVSTKAGFHTNTDQGDFFGEGALLDPRGLRSASIKCLTPVHAIEISREYFEKYLADGYDAQLSLREKHKMRKRNRAKTVLSLQKNMKEVTFMKDEYFYKQGEKGKELFILEDGKADVLVDNHTVFSVRPGELCGEHALLFGRPRNTSGKCVTDSCTLHVLKASDFFKLLKTHPSVQETLRDIGLRRQFQKALVFATKKEFPTMEKELREAFEAADYNRSGRIDLSDITVMLKNMDSTFTDADIKEILGSLDLDGSGAVNWEEFKRIFGMADDAKM